MLRKIGDLRRIGLTKTTNPCYINVFSKEKKIGKEHVVFLSTICKNLSRSIFFIQNKKIPGDCDSSNKTINSRQNSMTTAPSYDVPNSPSKKKIGYFLYYD